MFEVKMFSEFADHKSLKLTENYIFKNNNIIELNRMIPICKTESIDFTSYL